MDDETKHVSFNSEAPQPAAENRRQVLQTGRYDRRAMRVRLEIDDYIEEHLPEIFGKEDIDDCPDIDPEGLMQLPAEERTAKLKEVLADAQNKDGLDGFCSELLQKIAYFESEFGGSLQAGPKKERPSLQ